ncbi:MULTISPECIES: flagellar protein FliT [Ramlibacter]|uniref:Flagellar protein FliT n=1 Tax=Ramlibacter aquaticus TaxID=2780094 RepID=A0ABR9SAF9_9BURK|nr:MULTISPECIES: flagellar protein FliT [Ramlibacter]MBE7939209.1 flagellar protein FliT [Ramlibacter aquaticus]
MKGITIMDRHAPSELLRHYAALEAASHDMLRAAREADWDTVCRLEGACAVVIARLRDLVAQRAPDAHEQAERMRILRTILANDAEIRRICAAPPATDPSAMASMQEGWVAEPSPWMH